MKMECLPLGGGSYSTSERLTGRKWIDGKDIYEKVYTGNIGTLTVGTTKDIEIDQNFNHNIINVYGYQYQKITSSLTVTFQIPGVFTYSSNTIRRFTGISIASDGHLYYSITLNVQGDIDGFNNQDFYIVVEYV